MAHGSSLEEIRKLYIFGRSPIPSSNNNSGASWAASHYLIIDYFSETVHVLFLAYIMVYTPDNPCCSLTASIRYLIQVCLKQQQKKEPNITNIHCNDFLFF